MANAIPANLTEVLRRARARRPSAGPRRRCFISYHLEDFPHVVDFITEFAEVFLPTALGITDGANFVDSDHDEYIKRRIRELRLASTTVTIVLVGDCTWSRQFIDWEIAASLRDTPRDKRSGLLAVPVRGLREPRLPDRLSDNWVSGRPQESYAEFRPYPESPRELRRAIEAAFAARTAKAHLVDNSRPLRRTNARCRTLR